MYVDPYGHSVYNLLDKASHIDFDCSHTYNLAFYSNETWNVESHSHYSDNSYQLLSFIWTFVSRVENIEEGRSDSLSSSEITL